MKFILATTTLCFSFAALADFDPKCGTPARNIAKAAAEAEGIKVIGTSGLKQTYSQSFVVDVVFSTGVNSTDSVQYQIDFPLEGPCALAGAHKLTKALQ